ncbi:urea ABC transporter ATP-binding subunit UrtE [Roseinatronobacter monicus]|uniref:Amino acid/amide ABC transporter ATP-binding protein 2 (HAAT family) n=1 Tax=Roseinatronobacter monicus TaxID=393481 RepID=A0A543K4T2_9RHOB|nr:urea ABC transporter ATP-binding subunit UrtE [Roseinatronobacter monicus]TQM90087.1 amino acid/amide ABC transporter ATP-binding protein 2 (HAAT family) [Roseinatronobacter monicus]
MLQAKNLYSYYGKSPVLQNIGFTLEPGKLLSVLGRNGVGKTTLMRTIMGLTDRVEGTLTFDGKDIASLPTSDRALLGIGYIPQGREVIPRFTVEENIVMGTYARKDGSRDIPEYIFDLFPVLREFLHRRGGDLSGGQQQQIAFARALAMKPKLLILDEPTEGIQPNIVQQIHEVITRLNREFGLTIVLVEQNVPFVREVSDQFIVIDKGRVAAVGTSQDLTDELIDRHLTF